MGTNPTKAADNVFYLARKKASMYNEKLCSRAGAAELLGYASSSTISDWELGISLPTAQAVLKMSDLYHAPELINLYCTSMCPLGKTVQRVDTDSLDRITIQALSTFEKVMKTRGILLEITADGVITEDEEDSLDLVIQHFEELEKVAQNLKLWVKKNLREHKEVLE
ncbi:DNA-binding transcriptional regulator [Butyrivibrio sp.]|uniref:helix-turn-helix domain-containing protein n=1 Tax=Butyrivibrio sp. TaxID=28121 RepID=UPI0025BCD76A|nr:helix-turn-helix transcriptional regulator [Butyrivibrio sp.]MBQ9305828.1 helix-turn-helix transcriptional regulator [Butyrivibrio sp.]